jgi:hypothetical protein
MQVIDILPKQFPEFVRENHPQFVEFVKAYYEWVESQSIGKIESIVDIDNTVDNYVKYFKSQLDVLGEDYNFISPRLFLRNSKNLFTAKGSEQSIKFLFKLLYGESSDVIIPWDYVLIPSGGKWYQDQSIFVTTSKGSAANLTGTYIDITGTDGKIHRAFVISVIKFENEFNDNVYELFLDRFYNSHITFDCKFKSVDNSVQGVLLRTTTRVQVDIPGTGFEVGQLYTVDGYSGKGSIIKIKSVYENGGVKTAELIAFGTNYTTNFTTQIYSFSSLELDRFTKINLNLDASNPANDLIAEYPTREKLNNSLESGIITRHNYTGTAGTFAFSPVTDISPGLQYVIDTVGNTDFTLLGAASNTVGVAFIANSTTPTGSGTVIAADDYFRDNTYVGEVAGDIQQQQNAKFALVGTGATLRIITGGIANYPGYYLTGESILDDLSYIQDSYKYQKFSYITSIGQTLDSYKQILKRTLHPLGTELFGNYSAVNDFSMNMSVDPQLNLISLTEPYRDYAVIADASPTFLFTKNSFDSTVGITENIVSFNVTKGLFDTPVVTENGISWTMNSLKTDTVITVTAGPTFEFNKYLSDIFAANDAIAFSMDKVLSPETATVTDSPAITVNKLLTDSATAADTLASFDITLGKFDTVTTTTADPTFSVDKALYDMAQIQDFVPAFEVDKLVSDSVTLSDNISFAKSLVRSFGTETVTTTDSIAIIRTIAVTYIDSVAVLDAISFTPARVLYDNTIITDTNVTLSVDKYNTDAVALTNSGGLFMEPWYVEVTPPYWQAGYLENERLISN